MEALGLACMWVLTDTHEQVSTAVLSSTYVYVNITTSCLDSLFSYYSGLLARLIFTFVLSKVKYYNQSLSLTHSLHFLILVLF